ncbi:MAG TPA: phosphomethylpyrimidine synthase ThiC [bacterium]|nr:phosphomethylpyrimidine synthase ThiC [bacterium]
MTQLEAARAGKITEEMKRAAQAERMDAEELRRRVAAGRIVICRNTVHDIAPLAIGEGCRVKVNANIGTSEDVNSLEEELEKARIAVRYGADAVMDLSTGGDLELTRKKIMKAAPVAIGTVPIYQAIVQVVREMGKSFAEMTADEIFGAIERQVKSGVDFITVHCGVNRHLLDGLKDRPRLMGIVSRGGSITARWMAHNNAENPLYEQFDRLLDIARAHDCVLSLGDGLRPGALADATDHAQIEELITLGKLTERARAKGVQVMIEGPGHVPLHQVAANMQIQKALCNGAPFYVLGPLVTDVAPGYDHITSAIGGALAAMSGADFLCYVTPAEHLSLPTVDDVKEGVVASRIAAHAADIAKGWPGAADWDREMSCARRKLDWKRQEELALDPEKVRRYRDRRGPKADTETCSMCGDLCAVKNFNDAEEKLKGR